ncbi:hypothetical protein GCK32_022518, partial [Trichostrongylus colubriformis]
MVEKYSGPPFYAIHHHEMYAFTLPRGELLGMLPTNGSHLAPLSLKEMNAEQFDKVCAYDELVTGRNRRAFLKNYHSLFFTKGEYEYMIIERSIRETKKILNSSCKSAEFW